MQANLEWKTWVVDIVSEEQIGDQLSIVLKAFFDFVKDGLEEKWLRGTNVAELQLEGDES